MERSEHPCPDMGIDGVSFQPLKVITTPGGPVMHMLRPDSPLRPHAETADGAPGSGAKLADRPCSYAARRRRQSTSSW